MNKMRILAKLMANRKALLENDVSVFLMRTLLNILPPRDVGGSRLLQPFTWIH